MILREGNRGMPIAIQEAVSIGAIPSQRLPTEILRDFRPASGGSFFFY
jgi:hypothetical protein